MNYTQQDILKIASRIHSVKESGNFLYIKLKSGNTQDFNKDLIAVGFPKDDIYEIEHKNGAEFANAYTLYVVKYAAGHHVKKSEIIEDIEKQQKRLAAFEILRKTGGMEMTATEKNYLYDPNVQKAQKLLDARDNFVTLSTEETHFLNNALQKGMV